MPRFFATVVFRRDADVYDACDDANDANVAWGADDAGDGTVLGGYGGLYVAT